MGKIRLLEEHIANQIAAGEVVERPASIVKELIENAIDAESTRIVIEVEEGGLALIRVVDNGVGMDREDALLAFSRHATSKIRTGRDLFHLRSLGFRGEALPSMAAVSKVECLTSTEDGAGNYIQIEGGNIVLTEDRACPRGTELTVRQLFFNTPARLKYMKTIQTELGHITDVIYRAAMANPHVAFIYRHEHRTLLQTSGKGDLLQVIAAVYGTAAAKGMLAVKAENLDFELTGFVGKPEFARANRQGITFVVNGRPIRNHALFHSLMNAFHTLLPLHRYPLAVINLTMEPILVDVNVHPAKLEVRFSKEAECCQFLQSTVEKVLKKETLIPRPFQPASNQQAKITFQQQMDLYRPIERPPMNVQENGIFFKDRKSEVNHFVEHPLASEKQPTVKTIPTRSESSVGTTTDDPLEEPISEPLSKKDRMPTLIPLAQVHGTYILAQNEEGLFIIDQHAAHERVYYERFFAKLGQPESSSQQLLYPIVLETSARDASLVHDSIAKLEQFGVYMESFGGNTFIVRAVPTWFPKGSEQEVIDEMLEHVRAEKDISLPKLREKAAITLSCKTAIKANKRLSFDEMNSLLIQLQATDNPFTCPHGRPIVVHFTTYDLEKMFKRVM